MHYGISTLIEFDSIEKSAEFANRLGLSFVEISMDLFSNQLHLLDRDELIKIKEKYGVFFTLHLSAFLNISEYNLLVRNAWLESVKQTIYFAKATDIKIINMHLNKSDYFTLPEGKVYLYEKYEDDYLKSIRDFVKLCEDEIGDSKITITIENTGGFASYHKKALKILLESEVFGLCYDLGHDYKCEKPDEEFYFNNKEKLYHIHFHDSTKDSDHLPLGEGENNLRKYLYLANELSCTVVLEIKTKEGIEKSVNWLLNTPLPINTQEV